jgi:hypothetical protein
MQKIYFESATSEDFLKVLHPLWLDETFSICLIGHSNLAVELATIATQQGVVLQRSDVLPVASSKKNKLLIFTETSGEELSRQLLSCVDLDDVVVVAPVTDWHFSQKPLFLISIPKSGTHLIYELAQALGYHAGVEAPEFPLGQTWYCVEYTNSHTVARDFFVDTVRRSPFGNRHHSFMRSPALFMYRHPLDILISEAHYYHQDGKTAFAGWLDGLNFDKRIDRLMNDNWLIGSLRERITGFIPWMDFPNVISLSFEELIGAAGGGSDTDQLQLIWSIQLKLQVPGNPGDVATRIFNPDSATFRSGQIGAYKKHLSQNVVSDFLIQNEDILTNLGYAMDDTGSLPVDKESRRKRKLGFSKVDYENEPFIIESDFLGCNLVRYLKRIYAIPMSAGPVSFKELPEEVLVAIPSALSLSEIKAILLLGGNEISLRRQSFDHLAQAIQGMVPLQSIYQFWKDANTPCFIGEHNGFNLILFMNRFFGIRKSIGSVDLTQNLTSLVQRFASDDFVISHSIVQLCDDIDGFSTSKRVCQEAVVAVKRAMSMLDVLRWESATALELMQTRTATNETQLHGLTEAAQIHRQVVGTIEARLTLMNEQIIEHDLQIRVLQANWSSRIARVTKRLLLRVARVIKRILRGNK